MDKIIDGIIQVVDRSGVKWLVAIILGGGPLYLVYIDKARDIVGIGGAVIIAGLFMYFRNREHKQELDACCECEDEDGDEE